MGIHQPWEKGVELELHGLGKYRTVKSTEDAAYSLLNRWPDTGTVRRSSAQRRLAWLH
jgi:hypothetical protein